MKLKKRILVAPLNWGLGHATRCIPIINALIKYNFEPIIGSDGKALALLKKEFPSLNTYQLPSYNITYPKQAKHLKLKLIKNAPRFLKTIYTEKNATHKLVKDLNLSGIISDNRFGVYSKFVPSIYITHQLTVLSGKTSWLSSKIHQHIIKRYDECWIPDIEKKQGLSGKLGHFKNLDFTTKYLGVISRFNMIKMDKNYDLLVLLSGPEPQRTLFENDLLIKLNFYKGSVLFIRGVVEAKQTQHKKKHITIINYMQTNELEIAINTSKLVLSRSGYTTILDLAKLQKKAFFIPTPGQFEQEYLAKHLDTLHIAPFCKQKDFKVSHLQRVKAYKGFAKVTEEVNFKSLFSLF